jgi:hypothetical protein
MPTVAAVTGHAAAAGCALALAHDSVVMRASRGFLYMSEVDAGIKTRRWGRRGIVTPAFASAALTPRSPMASEALGNSGCMCASLRLATSPMASEAHMRAWKRGETAGLRFARSPMVSEATVRANVCAFICSLEAAW